MVTHDTCARSSFPDRAPPPKLRCTNSDVSEESSCLPSPDPEREGTRLSLGEKFLLIFRNRRVTISYIDSTVYVLVPLLESFSRSTLSMQENYKWLRDTPNRPCLSFGMSRVGRSYAELFFYLLLSHRRVPQVEELNFAMGTYVHPMKLFWIHVTGKPSSDFWGSYARKDHETMANEKFSR